VTTITLEIIQGFEIEIEDNARLNMYQGMIKHSGVYLELISILYLPY